MPNLVHQGVVNGILVVLGSPVNTSNKAQISLFFSQSVYYTSTFIRTEEVNRLEFIYILLLIKYLNGAQGRNRTTDTRIFSPLLYRLSYLGIGMEARIK